MLRFSLGLVLTWIDAALWMAVLHEAGHFLYFKLLGRNVKIYFHFESLRNFGLKVGAPWDYKDLTSYQLYWTYLSGILMGMVPVLGLLLGSPVHALLLPLYLVGCKHDLKQMWRLVRHGSRSNQRTHQEEDVV